jgi:hypothetical protein
MSPLTCESLPLPPQPLLELSWPNTYERPAMDALFASATTPLLEWLVVPRPRNELARPNLPPPSPDHRARVNVSSSNRNVKVWHGATENGP